MDSWVSETLRSIFEIEFFNFYFLNVDLSLIMQVTNLKFLEKNILKNR